MTFPSNKHCFFPVNFLINTAFGHFRMQHLLGAGTAFIRGQHLFYCALLKCEFYWSVAFMRGWCLIEEI